MKPRAISLPYDRNASREERSDMVSIPIVGCVTAGAPILATENIEEYVSLPQAMLGEGEHYILSVRGESMIEAGIMDGDFVVVRKQPHALNGDIVVAMIEDEATVKRFYRENGVFRLQPENSTMKPIIVPEVTILGKVVSLYRVY
jgi:repressor LexA